MAEVVLDASALLAFLKGEAGSAQVKPALSGGVVSAVNHAEVGSHLASAGLSRAEIETVLRGLRIVVQPFDEGQSLEVARLRPLTRHLGLSLGDRACLALGAMRRLPVLTTEQRWTSLDLGVEVRVIR